MIRIEILAARSILFQVLQFMNILPLKYVSLYKNVKLIPECKTVEITILNKTINVLITFYK